MQPLHNRKTKLIKVFFEGEKEIVIVLFNCLVLETPQNVNAAGHFVIFNFSRRHKLAPVYRFDCSSLLPYKELRKVRHHA